MAVELKKIDLIEENSELVQEVMEKKPSWIVLTGTTFVFFTILIAVFLLWLIKYPDVIVAKITLTHSDPPVQIYSKASGPLIFFVTDNEHINQNQPIGFIKTSVDYYEAIALKDSVSKFATHLGLVKDSLRTSFIRRFNNLGAMQNSVNQFKELIQRYQFLVYYRPIDREIESLQNQLVNYRKFDDLLSEKIETSSRQFTLAEQDFKRSKKLFNENVLSAKDFETEENHLLEVKSLLESAHLQKQGNLTAISEVQTSLLRVRNDQERLARELKLAIENSAKDLMNNISTWEQNYVLKSPREGNVSFFKYWNNEQFVSEGTQILAVISHLGSEPIGRVESPIYNSGKIQVSQRVNILLDSYPYQEYGPLIGKVESISPLQRQEGYLLLVTLNNGLVTSFGKRLVFKQEMTGVAEIVTEDIRLLDRIFRQITKDIRKTD